MKQNEEFKNENPGSESGNGYGRKKRGYNKYKNTGSNPVKPLTKAFDYDKIKSNNIIWWNQNKEQFNEVTKVPNWPHIQGRPYLAGASLPVSTQVSDPRVYNITQSMPGIMILNYVPTIGLSTGPESPVNKAFNILMSSLYAKTSGSSLNFTQGALAKMIISMSSIASGFGAVKRMLGVKDFWITRNIYYPRTLAKALGLNDYDDMVRNFNSYITRLDDLIARFNSIKIPSWFNIFARHYSLAKNVYVDEDSEFGQLFAYRPKYLWKYQDVSTSGVGICRPVLFDGDTIEDYLNIIEDCIDQWLNSQDLYLINGALLRAFPDSSFIFVEPFKPEDRVNTITDTYLSMQTMNATICGELDALATWDFDISEDVVQNAIIFQPKVIFSTQDSLEYNHEPKYVMCRVYQDSTNADENMELTRLAVTTKLYIDDDDNMIYELTSMGTEVITSVDVYTLDRTVPVHIVSNVYELEREMNKDGANTLFNVMRALSPFRFYPRLSVAYFDDDYDGLYRLLELGDYYQYSTISDQNLKDLHQAALYSVWKPMIK